MKKIKRTRSGRIVPQRKNRTAAEWEASKTATLARFKAVVKETEAKC